jgi:hypothetical protein
MNVEDLTLGQIKEIQSMMALQEEAQAIFQPGEKYFIRSVTHHYTGRCVSEVPGVGVILSEAAWIADDGRFADALRTGEFSEVEPYPDGINVMVFIPAMLDRSKWPHDLPRTQK